MSKRSEFLKGKSFDYFVNLTPDEFAKMQQAGNEWMLRASVTSMASTVNKRLKEFAKRGIDTPATNYIHNKFGPKIRVGDMTQGQLVSTYFELKGFGEAETSTIKGWNIVKNKVQERLEDEGITISDVDYDDLWEAFDKVLEINKNRIKKNIPGASEFDRDMKYKIIDNIRQKLIKNPNRNPNNIARGLFRKNKSGKTGIDKIYEQMEADRRATEDKLSAARYL